MNNTEFLIKILRYSVCKNVDDNFPSCTENDAEAIYEIAKKQDLAHLLALSNSYMSSVSAETAKRISKSQMLAIFRYEKINYDYKYICDLFEKNEIEYIPLKGSVIRKLYPEPWMRTSCDIDILIKEDSVEKATELLCKDEMFKVSSKEFHDVEFTSKSGMALELHFNIEENSSKMDKVLSRAWENINQCDKFEKNFTDEFMFFHIIAHAAHHFLQGGCGIRPILDLWLMKESIDFDHQKLNEFLMEAGLYDFATHMFELCDVWFSGKEHTEITQNMQDYILCAGIYGNLDNKVLLSAGNGNKAKYIVQRIFHPYEKLAGSYPKLKKYPFLYPYYTLKRWIRIILGKNRAKAIHEITSSATFTDKDKNFGKLRDALKLDI